MVERLKSGTSIKDQLPSRLDSTTNLGTFRVQVGPTICKYGAPTPAGSKSSSIRTTNSSTGLTIRSLMSEEVKTLKATLSKYGATMDPRLRNGMYLDKAKAVATKGVSEEFGFHINRPFYIRSRLPMKRIIECIGANNVTQRRWRKNTRAQEWFFDGVSKTIKNNNWKSHSLDIQSNGNSSNIRCTTTNSRWW